MLKTLLFKLDNIIRLNESHRKQQKCRVFRNGMNVATFTPPLLVALSLRSGTSNSCLGVGIKVWKRMPSCSNQIQYYCLHKHWCMQILTTRENTLNEGNHRVSDLPSAYEAIFSLEKLLKYSNNAYTKGWKLVNL